MRMTPSSIIFYLKGSIIATSWCYSLPWREVALEVLDLLSSMVANNDCFLSIEGSLLVVLF